MQIARKPTGLAQDTPRPFASADNRNAIARIAKKEISKNSALFFKARLWHAIKHILLQQIFKS